MQTARQYVNHDFYHNPQELVLHTDKLLSAYYIYKARYLIRLAAFLGKA